eukprot:scaffold1530_cov98-Cylindrotheca_fusiformis.AAC.10
MDSFIQSCIEECSKTVLCRSDRSLEGITYRNLEPEGNRNTSNCKSERIQSASPHIDETCGS